MKKDSCVNFELCSSSPKSRILRHKRTSCGFNSCTSVSFSSWQNLHRLPLWRLWALAVHMFSQSTPAFMEAFLSPSNHFFNWLHQYFDICIYKEGYMLCYSLVVKRNMRDLWSLFLLWICTMNTTNFRGYQLTLRFSDVLNMP